MELDVLIKNGHVIDTLQHVDQVRDIGICDGRIVDIDHEDVVAQKVINAEGCFVFPGLVDFHTHLFYTGSGIGINPELMLANGVTSAVDQGTSGCSNYEAFNKSVILNTDVKIKTFINVYSGGQLDSNIIENLDPELFNEHNIRLLKEKYKDKIIGLKVRISKNIVGNSAIDVLKATIELAEKIGGLAVCVHTTEPACEVPEIAGILRKGDIYCHVYNGKGNNIIDCNGNVYDEIKEARKRGVIFDTADGKTNYSNKVAAAAIKNNFLPDIISSDITSEKHNYGNFAKSLPFVISKYISMNVDIKKVIRSVTETPAKIMGMENKIGTLKSGAYGDVAIFKLISKKVIHKDYKLNTFVGNKILIPQMTISNGKIVYSQEDFNI